MNIFITEKSKSGASQNTWDLLSPDSYLRDTLYEIFIYNLNIYTCLNYIIYNLVNENYINDKNTYNILLYLFKFLKLYNNNYRPIYHLERFIFYLCIEIHEL